MNLATRMKPIKLSPTQLLVTGFAVIIFIGTILLNLPISTSDGQSIGIVNALFTATSAVCVTGLVVVDTGTRLSFFGQVVVISLIQAGGLGFMTMATMIFLLMGKRITLRERLVIQEALNQFTLEGVVRLTRNILIVTLLIEGAGASLLAIRFIPLYGWRTGLYYSVFHSISAFCNAGFDLMGNYISLTGFTGDILFNFTIMGLIIAGGLGFSVILDIYSHPKHFRRWSLHSKLVVLMSGALILLGFLFILAVEFNNPNTLGLRSLQEKLLGALFQSVTTRTAGFNSIDIAGLTNASKFMMIILMFIGASPASTGGGIKTTTFSMILLMAYSMIKGREDNVIFGRHIPHTIAIRALTITLISLTTLIVITMVLSLVEFVPFLDIMFQTASALGTVGLAGMDTGGMQDISKILLSLTMFMGRVGPLTLTMAFASRQSQNKNTIKYPEERIMVG